MFGSPWNFLSFRCVSCLQGERERAAVHCRQESFHFRFSVKVPETGTMPFHG